MSATAVKYTGSGAVAAADFKYVKWVGKTKSGVAVTIELPKAICRSNPNWKFDDRNDVIAAIEYEGVYDDDDLSSGDRTEPWTIECADNSVSGASEILLGVGKFYVGTSSSDATAVALTRGGGAFIVERVLREINADGDPGAVEGRIVQEEGRPKLSLNALTWLSKVGTLYAGMKTTT